ncbi:MAG: response regulator [Desulfarculaceae bacterium]|nr:response regulator [Desulfarculaceae bacterium]
MHRTIKVLTVDDDREFAAALAERLELRGLWARPAYGGWEALRIVEDWSPEVVVLDVDMPLLDGIATLGHLKRLHPGVEVILLTGRASVSAAMEGLALGAFEFLIKPTPIEELIRCIEEACRRGGEDGEPGSAPVQGE